MENGDAIAKWIYEDVLCRWSALSEIVTNNGAPISKGIEALSTKYRIHHIRISGYTSHANGSVERSHLNVRQTLFKVVEGDTSKWASADYAVF